MNLDSDRLHRLALVGDPGVGKTSIFNRFCDEFSTSKEFCKFIISSYVAISYRHVHIMPE